MKPKPRMDVYIVKHVSIVVSLFFIPFGASLKVVLIVKSAADGTPAW